MIEFLFFERNLGGLNIMLRDLKPTDNVGGFDVRPGNFLLNGATTVSGGVNFTIHSVYAIECTLLLFRPYAKFPYARLRFPDSYKIGNTYSMLVFGLDEVDFEYAYSFDGPYVPEKGIIFDKKKTGKPEIEEGLKPDHTGQLLAALLAGTAAGILLFMTKRKR